MSCVGTAAVELVLHRYIYTYIYVYVHKDNGKMSRNLAPVWEETSRLCMTECICPYMTLLNRAVGNRKEKSCPDSDAVHVCAASLSGVWLELGSGLDLLEQFICLQCAKLWGSHLLIQLLFQVVYWKVPSPSLFMKLMGVLEIGVAEHLWLFSDKRVLRVRNTSLLFISIRFLIFILFLFWYFY